MCLKGPLAHLTFCKITILADIKLKFVSNNKVLNFQFCVQYVYHEFFFLKIVKQIKDLLCKQLKVHKLNEYQIKNFNLKTY